MTYEHYIITRFNLPVFAKKVNKAVTSTAISEEYLDNRFPLFESYCLPSIKNQTCQNFKWLVLFDINTPQRFKNWAERMHQEYPNFIPCYFDIDKYNNLTEDYFALYKKDYARLHESDEGHVNETEEIIHHVMTPAFIRDEIRKLSNTIPDYYITTRIDNDDAFHKDMIATVQKMFLENPKRVLYDFPYLYKYVLHQGVVYKFPLINGHFSTLVEPGSITPNYVVYWNHLHVERFVDTIHMNMKPMGVELVHGMNVCNDFTDCTNEGIFYGLRHFNGKDFGYKNAKISILASLRIIAFHYKMKIKNLLK